MATALTAFGNACRAERTKRGLVMADQAKAIGCSVAFISALETGLKPVPEGYLHRVCEWLSLNTSAKTELMELADSTRKVVRFVPADRQRAALASDLARLLNDTPIEKLARIRTLLLTEEENADR